FVYGSHAQAQYSIQPVAELGVVKTKYLHFDPERNNWLLSDGYSVWEADKDFLKTKLLYNSFPGYQYEIDRLPNGNIFNRQFDYTASIFNNNTHYNKLDSASIFITNSQKQA